MKKTAQLFIFVVIMLSIAATISGCAARSEHRDAKYVRSGILKQGLDMQAFLDVWGSPDRTRSITDNDANTEIVAKWSVFGGDLIKGKKTFSFQEWDYQKLGVSLLFDKEDLAFWKTDKTVAEIKAMAGPR